MSQISSYRNGVEIIPAVGAVGLNYRRVRCPPDGVHPDQRAADGDRVRDRDARRVLDQRAKRERGTDYGSD